VAKKGFEAVEAALRGGQFAEVVTQAPGGRSPQGFKIEVKVGELVSRSSGKGRKAARTKHDADQVGKVGGVNHIVDGASANDLRGWRLADREDVRTVEKEVAC